MLTATPPDVSRVIPLARVVRPRALRMREIVLDRGVAHGVDVLDVRQEPAAVDPGLWTPDRLHPNAHGHRLLAHMAARRLGLDVPVAAVAAADVAAWSQLGWVCTAMIPWLVRHYRGRSAADGRAAKRPLLSPP